MFRIVGYGPKTTYWIDRRQVTKAEFDQACPDQPIGDGSGLVGWARPVVSDALAVHELDVGFARVDAQRKGVPVEFQADGRPVFRSSRQFRAYAKAYGFRHRGY